MAKIEIENVSVNYFLRKRGDVKKMTERGAVGAEVIVGKRFLEVAALKDVSVCIREETAWVLSGSTARVSRPC